MAILKLRKLITGMESRSPAGYVHRLHLGLRGQVHGVSEAHLEGGGPHSARHWPGHVRHAGALRLRPLRTLDCSQGRD